MAPEVVCASLQIPISDITALKLIQGDKKEPLFPSGAWDGGSRSGGSSDVQFALALIFPANSRLILERVCSKIVVAYRQMCFQYCFWFRVTKIGIYSNLGSPVISSVTKLDNFVNFEFLLDGFFAVIRF